MTKIFSRHWTLIMDNKGPLTIFSCFYLNLNTQDLFSRYCISFVIYIISFLVLQLISQKLGYIDRDKKKNLLHSIYIPIQNIRIERKHQ